MTCKVLHWVEAIPDNRRLAEPIESNPAEKDLGVLMDEEQDMRQQCVLTDQKAQMHLGLHQKRSGQEVKGGDSLLYCDLMRPHLQWCIQLWGPQLKKDVDLLRAGPQEATKMVKGSCEARLKELGLFNLEKALCRDLIRSHGGLSVLKGGYKKEGEQLFT